METHICLGGKAWIGVGILQGDTMTGLFWRDQQSLFMDNFSRGSLSFFHPSHSLRVLIRHRIHTGTSGSNSFDNF